MIRALLAAPSRIADRIWDAVMSRIFIAADDRLADVGE